MSRVGPGGQLHLRDDSSPVDLLGEVDSHINTISVESLDHTHTRMSNRAPLVPGI